MKVCIVGGTGLIGYHSALAFLKKGHEVTAMALPDITLGDWFPQETDVRYGNVFEMGDAELKDVFEGYDAMVYAVGPDDRYRPKSDAYTFFHERLVEACGRVISMAREAGVKRAVILNSYFAYFARVYPEWHLMEHHPYIRCRVEQAEHAIAEGGGQMDVMILELPYIFGTMPERKPLWDDVLIQRFARSKTAFFPKGGTTMITVEHVAEAVVGAVEHGEHGKRYPIGDVNMPWDTMIRIMLDAMGMEQKKIVTVPDFLAILAGKWMKRKERREGYDSGLDLAHLFKDIQCRYTYFDPSESSEALRYNRGGVEEAIVETVRACVSDRRQ